MAGEIAVNGYRVIRKRVADAVVLQEDVEPVGVAGFDRATEVQGDEPTVAFRRILLDDVGLDGHSQVVGLRP
jgi:hypothetical protein